MNHVHLQALKFGPDGILYSGSYDGTCKSWDVSSMTHLQTFCSDSDEADMKFATAPPVQVRWSRG